MNKEGAGSFHPTSMNAETSLCAIYTFMYITALVVRLGVSEGLYVGSRAAGMEGVDWG